MQKLEDLRCWAADLRCLDGHAVWITGTGNSRPACEAYDGAHETKHKAQQHQILQITQFLLLQSC